METYSEGVPPLCGGAGEESHREGTQKRQRSQNEHAACGEWCVCHVIYRHRCVGTMVDKQAGGHVRVSAPMITRLDFIAKAVEGHYRV